MSAAQDAPGPSLQEVAAEWVPTTTVLLATPTNRGITPAYTASLLNTMGSQRVISDGVQVLPYMWPGESLIERARNDILRHFYYETDATHLFFIDDDIAWEPDAFFDVLAACSPARHRHVVGGVYPIKTLRWDRLVGQRITSIEHAKQLTLEIVVNDIQPDHDASADHVVVAGDLGTGFLCITRECIAALIEAYPEEWYASNARGEEPKQTPNLFGVMIDGVPGTMSSTLLSEDYAFCRRWQRVGGLCFAHLGIPMLTHMGNYAYGSLS